jgi:predicted transcriptional regulator
MQATLKRREIRAVLRRHFGSSGEIARELGIRPQNISKWLKGQTTSARIAEAATRKTLQLLAEEQGYRISATECERIEVGSVDRYRRFMPGLPQKGTTT